MPMYEYRCGACGHAFERYASGGAQEEVSCCPECGKPKVKKVFSTFSSNACCGPSLSGGSSGGCGGGSSQFS